MADVEIDAGDSTNGPSQVSLDEDASLVSMASDKSITKLAESLDDDLQIDDSSNDQKKPDTTQAVDITSTESSAATSTEEAAVSSDLLADLGDSTADATETESAAEAPA